MKLKSFSVPAILLAVLIALGISCKKSSDTPEPTPDYPQLIGTWMGMTSGNDTISITIGNVGGYLKVTGYKYAVRYSEGSTSYKHSTSQYNSYGFCSAANKTFSFVPAMPMGSAVDTVNGNFDVNEMTLTGKIKATFTEATGSPVVRLTYGAIKLPQVK